MYMYCHSTLPIISPCSCNAKIAQAVNPKTFTLFNAHKTEEIKKKPKKNPKKTILDNAYEYNQPKVLMNLGQTNEHMPLTRTIEGNTITTQ